MLSCRYRFFDHVEKIIDEEKQRVASLVCIGTAYKVKHVLICNSITGTVLIKTNCPRPSLCSKTDFDLSYFLCPLRYRIIQYLILKLRLVVNMSYEGQGVVALLSCARLSSKTQFYYIWRVLGNLF